MTAAILLLASITPAAVPPATTAKVTVIRADRVRNVNAGAAQPAIRVTVEVRGERSYYWWDIPGRRWYWSDSDRGKVSKVIDRGTVPQKVRYAVLALLED